MRPPTLTTIALLLAALAPAGTALAQEMRAAALVPPFSTAKPGKPPAPWDTIRINDRKTLTTYEIVQNSNESVLHAIADTSASALGVAVSFDIKAAPVLSWRWRVAGLIPDADNSVASKEDSPVPAAMRQIAEEVRFTVRGALGDVLAEPYSRQE